MEGQPSTQTSPNKAGPDEKVSHSTVELGLKTTLGIRPELQRLNGSLKVMQLFQGGGFGGSFYT